MDSRIREIEQWIAEAKADLGACGREAFIRKLYLLDAEIRSVIKESGQIPGAASPQRPERRVRRLPVPSLATAGALGGLLVLLTATTVSIIRFAFPTTAPNLTMAEVEPTATISGELMADRGFTPSSVPGWEILPEDWTPDRVETPANEEPEHAQKVLLLAATTSATRNTVAEEASAKAPSSTTAQPAGSQLPTTIMASLAGAQREDAVDVMLGASGQPQLNPPVDTGFVTPPIGSIGSSSCFGGGSNVEVASMTGADFYESWKPVNSQKSKMTAKLSGEPVDKSSETVVDNGDNSKELELNVEELKKTFEKTLDG